jgi:TolA-binding protein
MIIPAERGVPARPSRLARRALRAAMPLTALAIGACFATRNDVRLLQDDVQRARAETQVSLDKVAAAQARADSVNRAMLGQALLITARLMDTVRALDDNFRSLKANLGQDIVDLQTSVTQVQMRLTDNADELRRLNQELASQQQQRAALQAADSAGPPTQELPAPARLLTDATTYLNNGLYSAARESCDTLLVTYPTSDQAPQAMMCVAESLVGEKNDPGADSVLALIPDRFPDKPQAATALYKLAVRQVDRKDWVAARRTVARFDEKYKSAKEAPLMADVRKQIPPG